MLICGGIPGCMLAFDGVLVHFGKDRRVRRAVGVHEYTRQVGVEADWIMVRTAG